MKRKSSVKLILQAVITCQCKCMFGRHQCHNTSIGYVAADINHAGNRFDALASLATNTWDHQCHSSGLGYFNDGSKYYSPLSLS
jgi:hypothetical protein